LGLCDLVCDAIPLNTNKLVKNSKNHAITEAENFDDDTTQLMVATVASSPVKDVFGHLKTRPGDQDHIKSAKDSAENTVNSQNLRAQIPHPTDR